MRARFINHFIMVENCLALLEARDLAHYLHFARLLLLRVE